MTTLKVTKKKIELDKKHWQIHLMDFVDDFRHYKDPKMISESFTVSDEKMDALLASLASALCDELKIAVPQWIEKIPAVKEPWFVSGIENLKAIALVESPLRFRMRKIFAIENFFQRI